MSYPGRTLSKATSGGARAPRAVVGRTLTHQLQPFKGLNSARRTADRATRTTQSCRRRRRPHFPSRRDTMSRINTNVSSLIAQRVAGENNDKLNTSLATAQHRFEDQHRRGRPGRPDRQRKPQGRADRHHTRPSTTPTAPATSSAPPKVA